MSVGERMWELAAELYPICRSITGDGVRQTLEIIGRQVPLEVHEVPSGTRVLDWTVPREWNLRDAWVKDPDGRKVIDARQSNLHVVSYSTPIRQTMPLAELKQHLHTLPEHPDWIPYRTSYYQEDWGFCLSDRQLATLPDGHYQVHVDTTLQDGSLTWAEHLVPGSSDQEVLLSCHVCHPSLANDNLSGIAVATQLARRLAQAPRRYSYRLLFVPGTIGSITWLALHQAHLGRIRHGLVLACVGDPGPLTYKRSRQADAGIDRAMSHVLASTGRPHTTVEFSPYGYDERQYCSPGFNLPVGSLSRTPYGQYPQYHTSADNLDFISPEAMADTLETCWAALQLLEADRHYMNLHPKGEPQLGRRGLYDQIGGRADTPQRQLAMLWTLNLSDGHHSLLDIAERSHLPFPLIAETATTLQDVGLLAASS